MWVGRYRVQSIRVFTLEDDTIFAYWTVVLDSFVDDVLVSLWVHQPWVSLLSLYNLSFLFPNLISSPKSLSFQLYLVPRSNEYSGGKTVRLYIYWCTARGREPPMGKRELPIWAATRDSSVLPENKESSSGEASKEEMMKHRHGDRTGSSWHAGRQDRRESARAFEIRRNSCP